MKDLFPGHYPPSSETKSTLWKEGLVCLDANVLLNLYRYTQRTRDDLVDAIRKLGPRLFLPHQAAEEFQRNRVSVIMQLAREYEQAKDEVRKHDRNLRAKFSTGKHPVIDSAALDKLGALSDEICAKLEQTRAGWEGMLENDPLHGQITELVGGRVGAPFSSEELAEAIADAKQRFAAKRPPGFVDDGEKCEGREFGDVILWKQVLREAKGRNSHIILVTDDLKEDWWWTVK